MKTFIYTLALLLGIICCPVFILAVFTPQIGAKEIWQKHSKYIQEDELTFPIIKYGY